MRNKIFISVFAVFLVLVMVSAPANRILTDKGILEKDNVGNDIKVEKVYKDSVPGAAVWNGIEEAKRELTDIYTNYIPFYVDITSAAKTFTQDINTPFSSLLINWGSNNTDTVSPSTASVVNATYLSGDSQNRFYQIEAHNTETDEKMSFYIRVPAMSLRNAMSRSTVMLNRINGFAEQSPDVNWYVYTATGFEDTELCNTVIPSEAKNEVFEKFFNGLNPEIKRGYVKINSVEDQNSKFFHTDHHWNVKGYTEAYSDIVGLFKENYGDIEMIKPEIISFPKVQYRGTHARILGRFDMYDNFAVADYELPDHTMVIEDGVNYNFKIPKETNMQNYLAEKHNTERAYSHYMAFQPIVEEITYTQNKTGRNLLIIGDSFSPPITEPLAAYFDKTYIRYIDSNPTLEKIQLDQYIDEHNITDVLFLEKSCRIMYNSYNDALKNIG